MPETLSLALFFVGAAALFNSIQTFVPQMRDIFIPKMFISHQASHLAARFFGHWTLISATIRLITSFNIYSKHMYVMTMLTFVSALLVFTSETFVYKTMELKSLGVFPVFIIAPVMLMWMSFSYQHYTRHDTKSKKE